MFRHLGFLLATLLTLTGLPLLATAQQAGQTILVLDASGSMWGQIDGKAKITIAQEVIGELLQTIPKDQALGLTAYGHRRKGDCGDIETLVLPGIGTRQAITEAVNAIKPKGKTPLSAAVISAAEVLKYTEQKATVILVSDGIENCKFDPCEVGKSLEEAGVDFTAHVIGFDVADPAERLQLQCLAENTGGVFRTASNAAELTDALKVVAAPPPPPPAPAPEEPAVTRISFVAVEETSEFQLTEGLRWTLTNQETGAILLEDDPAPRLDLDLPPGSYRMLVLRTENETTATADISVEAGTDATVTLVLPLILPEATLTAPQTARAGDKVDIGWTGPNEDRDYLATALADQPDNTWQTYSYTDTGAPLALQMPAQPGEYEIRYVLNSHGKVLARQTIKVLPVSATLDAPDQALAGATVDIGWSGPDYPRDFLSVAEIGADDDDYLTYSYTKAGGDLGLVMPSKPGDYEIRYVMNQQSTVLARKKITITAITASLNAPTTGAAGATITVGWRGPDYDRDFLSVAKVDDSAAAYQTYTYTRHGDPAELQLPAEPGTYEIRYVMSLDKTILARQKITISGVTASLSAPKSADVAASVTVDWQGPDYPRDFISVAKVGAADKDYQTYAYTRHGAPLVVKMPSEPGQYEIRYVQNQGGKVLARQLIDINPVSVTLDLPASGKAGAMLEVRWTGPDYERDYISVGKIGSRETKHINYSYTKSGSPLLLQMPAEPGTYAIRYMANASPDKMLAQAEITLAPVTASLTAPDRAKAGQELTVVWTGPDYRRDYIAIARAGDTRYATYTYTEKGAPAKIMVPDAPGDYEIWYVMKEGATVLARQTLTVE